MINRDILSSQHFAVATNNGQRNNLLVPALPVYVTFTSKPVLIL